MEAYGLSHARCVSQFGRVEKGMLLQYVAPDARRGANHKTRSRRPKRLNATTQFSVAQLVLNEDTLSVHLKGCLATFINDLYSDVERNTRSSGLTTQETEFN
jgi:hypothetical protein